MLGKNERGFTLIEMSVVIAVLAIVLTISVAGTSHLIRSSRLAGATNTLMADLRYAHSRATTERKTFQVVFLSNRYSIVRVTSQTTILNRNCPPGVSCSATDSATFYAWGLADPIAVTLATADGSKVLQVAANGNVTR